MSKTLLFYASQTNACTTETLSNSLPGTYMTLGHKAPIGVVGGIVPWNAPLIGQLWIIGAALATGCTVVLKPAEDASLSILRTAELLLEAGVPPGVINVVTGYGPEAGLRSPSTATWIASRSPVRSKQPAKSWRLRRSMKRLQLELGGKSPDIVFADANLDLAVPGAAMGVYTNSGQVCVAGSRLFVQRAIQREFVDRLKEFSRSLRIGNGLDPQVQLGPLISQRQLDRVTKYVDLGNREGARLAVGGGRLGGDLAQGYFFEPTVFTDVRNDMTIAREEIFGPVISVIPFDDIDEVIRLANDTPYGLAGGVWTRSAATAHLVSRGIKAGTIWVNSYGLLDPAVGFGGCKMSGYGWKGGAEHIEGFLYRKVVYMNLTPD